MRCGSTTVKPAVEVILMVFMTLSAVSFALYYLLYTGRSLRVLLDRELLATSASWSAPYYSYGPYSSSRAITEAPGPRLYAMPPSA